ncbi:hypothetical protein Cpap_1180 [Ruminiclostridium papyrosolvens DSM 2782]|uniref:Uncharacterized protein n=1 Tax=Ruminiclostridium papyrosolvens DSM 2782 TaxID=588581 RepID=F1TF47_9FIRM|nr:hypothetical protein [Ruminiclostridium papyrosolvens]EGD46985.1 hypothetical protein Cpap_1180 [Ruminiclostridium papyrosolvens DSM 2782]WES33767.1 hypothetical protein P0092_18660 [Ruminiclostridium papyrosolvens DSM 2782]
MRIVVNSVLMGNQIIGALTSYKEDNVNYEFISKNGMKIEFEVTEMEKAAAVDLTKKIIRSQDFGSALYFQVTV